MSLETVWHGGLWRERDLQPTNAKPELAQFAASTLRANLLVDLLDEPLTRHEIRVLTGWQDVHVFTAIRRLLKERRVIVVGKTPTRGRPAWRYRRVRRG